MGLNRKEKKGRADELAEQYKGWTRRRWRRSRTTGWWTRWRPICWQAGPAPPRRLPGNPPLSRGRSAVYSVWLICHECAEGGLTGWYAGSSSEFTDLAADGLELIGAAECAAAVRASRQEDADIGALSAVLDEAMKQGAASGKMRRLYPG